MKQQKTKRIARIASGIAIIIAMITIVSIFLETQKKQIAYQKDPEIRRMLNYDQVQKGDEAVSNTPYVQFDAFFLRDLDGDGYAEQVRGTCREISKSDTLYMNINVLTNGTLENGEISINGQNVKLTTALVEDNVIKQNYISDNTTSISLKNMQNGTQKLMYGTINPSDFGNDTTKYSKVNSITLTGTHVADDGTQTTISKTVNFNVDWYGTSNCMIYDYSRTQSNENIIDEAKENINLSFYITTEETKRNNEQLILKQAYLEGIIPQLNGYKPTKVEVTSSNVTFNYEEETGKFVVTRDATINSSGIVTKSISDYNTFTFKVSYPIAAYEVCDENTVAINIPIKAYYEGYNNTNEEFENPIRSNETQRTINLLWRKPEGSVARFDVTIGNYRSHDGQYVMSKIEPLKIYNGTAEETEDTYWVRWYAFTGNEFESQAIQMKETDISHTDRFQDNSSNYYDMASYLTNIGIYFSNVNNILGEEGYINVYNDETGELIHTFTKDDWNNYSSNNPYQYETSVKHIRIETSKAQKDSGLYIYHQKKIDDKILIKNFTKEQFDELAKVYTYLTGSIKKAEDITFTKINDDSACAVYEEPISVANLTIMPDTIGTQKTERNIKFNISTNTSYYNMQKWTNGRFLLELPAEILDLEINHISVSNTNVRVLGYEITEKNGKKYLKIETENKTEESYTITVDTNLTADPRVVTQTKTINLYAYNEYCDNYKNKIQDIYDVDGDGNKEEQVNLGTDSLTLVAPSSLLTNQQAIEYNDQGDTAVAPQIATIDKTEANTAKVNVSITNNYSGRISEVQILGKIPFKGNTFSINGTDLGSTYNTEMTATGIAIPTSLQGIATVYYSEKENPNKDLTDSTNGWTQTPDFSKVKSYLIDLGEYTLALKESLAFQYEIKVPTTVQYNDISYSTHAVYFCLDTVEGKFKTQTETTKLGFRIERKYHLTLQKTKEDTSVPVQGATFTIQEEGEEESRMGTSDRTGNIRIENLFVDKTYTLKEIRTPGSYEKNSMEVKFKVVVENDQLVLNILSGEEQLKASSITQASDTLKGIVNFKVENTPKYKVVITKKDQKTKEVLAGIKYKLEGTGLGNGIIVTTNKSGILTLTGLSHDVEYTLTEIEANGYYVNEIPIHFKVVKENGNLAFKVISGSFTSNSEVVTGTDVTGIEAQDTVTAELTDEKIPTFSISLKKYAQGENTVLKNAQYKITGEGIKESGETYSTDENGVLTISGLYEYVEGKNITGEYTLEEITPPEGYALDSTQLKFKAQRNTEGNLEISIISGGEIIRTVENNQDITITNSENENALITIGVEDEPLFKITKIDGTTKAVLPNTKFVLYEIDNNLNTIGYAKDINGNIVGTMQESNGEGSLSFTSEGESNMIWTKREDGTWESGGKSINSAVSSMISNSFLIEKNGTISFDWAVSSESVSYDYVYYTITNTKTGATIGGTSNKIGGNSSVTDYNKLTFNNVLVELSAGTYTIQFTYRKDRSGNNGLDAGFIKNVKVNGMNTAIPVVTTNKKGEISYGLKSGLYKAVEIEAVEGYELPEEAERTYYFGIGEAKAQETRFGVSYTKTIAGSKWNKIESIKKTQDEGFIVSGYFMKEADLNGDGVAELIGNDNVSSGFVAKYAQNGDLEFAKAINSTGNVKIKSVMQTNDGGYIAVGYFEGENLTIGDVNTGLTNTTSYKEGLVLKIGSSGDYSWCKEVEEASKNITVDAVTADLSGNIIVGVNTEGYPKIMQYSLNNGDLQNSVASTVLERITDLTLGMNQEIMVLSQDLTSTTKGNLETYENGAITTEKTLDFNANAISKVGDSYIIVGNYTGTAQSIATKGNYDGIIIKYTPSTKTISDVKTYRGSLDEVITSVAQTEDGGYLVGGYTYSSTVSLVSDDTTEISSISGYTDGFVVKYDSSNTQSWYKQIKGSGMDEVTSVAERTNGEYLAAGYFNSDSSSADQETSGTYDFSLSHYTDGFIVNYGEIITSPEVPESSEITVKNNLKQYKITTEVREVDGIKGGTISGEGQVPYEIVEYGKDSIKEIKMIPQEGYKIVSITINGEEYSYTPNADGSFTLPQFTNMTTDKHIIVTYKNNVSSIVIHHYIDGTNTQVPDQNGGTVADEHKSGIIGESYTTAPRMDLGEYELKKDTSGNYVIPDNASGKYTEQEQEIIYYYVKKQVPLVVHHYIEGTEEKVPLKDGTVAADETNIGEIGTNYMTEALTQEELNPKYELVAIPNNQNGTYTKNGVIVTYYYKAKEVKVTTKVKKHIETNEQGEDIQVKGGSVLGEGQTPYETVIYGENSVKDIIAIPDEGYQVKEIKVNGSIIDFTKEIDETVHINKFANMTEDKEVVVEFEKIPAKVTVHYYIENTTTKVPLNIGGTAQDIIKNGSVGDNYATKEAENISTKYELVKLPENSSGTMTKEDITVTYYYRLKDTSVLVHHYIDGTEVQVPKVTGGTVADQIIEGKIDDSYTTNVSTQIAQNYEVVSTKLPSNASGMMTESQIIVTYYYQLKTPTITNQNITKTGTNRITQTGDTVTYTVNYQATINNYIGDAKITIIDNLPYAIDTTKAYDLAGGIYNETNKTITWNDTETAINTFTNGAKTVQRSKTISIVFKDILETETSMTNLVNGKIETITPKVETTPVEDDYVTELAFHVNVKVIKNWVDNQNANERRPQAIKLTLKADGTQIEGNTYELSTSTNSQTSYEYTFTDLPKVNLDGSEINYTVTESVVDGDGHENDLKFYTSAQTSTQDNLGNKTITITNTFTRPNDKVKVTVNKTWVDNEIQAQRRPAQIKFTLTGNGITKTYNMNTADETSYIFENLDKYNDKGQEIDYTVVETVVDGAGHEEDLKFYQTSQSEKIDAAGNKTITIINTFTKPNDTKDITIQKVWEDNNNKAQKRPDSITLQLKGNGESKDITLTNANGSESIWTTVSNNMSVYNENGEEIIYTADEETVPEFYEKTTAGLTVTNRFVSSGEKISITVNKIWVDNEIQAQRRPAQIKFTVSGNETSISQTIASTDTSYTFHNLAKYDENADPITYIVTESVVDGDGHENDLKFYIANETSNTVDATGNRMVTITNTFTKPNDKLSVTVNKVWIDNEIQAQRRPAQIKFTLSGNGISQTYNMNTANETSYRFENLDKYNDNGQEIIYTVTESVIDGTEHEGDLKFYTASQTANTVDSIGNRTITYTNTFTKPEDTIDITAKKNWVEEEEKEKSNRPNEIYLQILKTVDSNMVLVQEAKVEVTDSMSHTFTGLAKYDSNGQEIVYHVGERAVNVGELDYYQVTTADPSYTNGQTGTITNTYIGPNINFNKKMITQKGQNYVVEGETITYQIEISNTGKTGKTVKVKDEVPAGTTYKVGSSIKVNGTKTEYTIQELAKGINVDVSAKQGETDGKVVVSFEVIVNNLDSGIYYKEIKNTAMVDDITTNEVKTVVNKAEIIANKVSTTMAKENTDNLPDGKVKKGDRIRYTITIENKGTLATNAIVKDSIPEGTVFISNSVKVNTNITTHTESNLANGLTVNIPANDGTNNGKVTVSFEVLVGDNTDGDIIRNTGSVDNTPTNETENLYVEPIIESKKEQITQNNQSYVVEGERITYKVTVNNKGGLAKEVVVKDEVPEGTTFIEGSIKINDKAENYTKENLKNGIIVNVPAKSGNTNGETTIIFEVIVNQLDATTYYKEIKNTAQVDNAVTNEVKTVVNKADVIADKVATVITKDGTENLVDGKVKFEDKIKYTIIAKNKGSLAKEVVVKDEIPLGTTLVPNSIRVNETISNKTEEDLKNGIRVNVPANDGTNNGKVTVSFEVLVGDNTDGDVIRNTGSVDNTPTNETENLYVEPMITIVKKAETQNKKGYVKIGDTINYTLEITNRGGLAKEVNVVDEIPNSVKFVENSLKINQESTEYTEENLRSGITIPVPEKQNGIDGKVTISFLVTVKEGVIGDIRNIGKADGTPSNEIITPVINFEKIAVITRKTAQEIEESHVTKEDEITYTIRINNTGTQDITDLEVKDSIPEGTTLKEVRQEGIQKENEITWNINSLGANSSKEVNFTVIVGYLEDGYTIRNIAYVGGDSTNEVVTENERPTPELDSKIEKTGTDKITKIDEAISYHMDYETTIKKYIGSAKVRIVDYLPYVIDEAKSDLAGGIYNKINNTIAWEIPIENINTYQDANRETRINVEKDFTVVYQGIDLNQKEILNKVIGTVELTDITKIQEVEDNTKTQMEIPGKVIVKYMDKDTKEELLPREEKTDIIGNNYTTEEKEIPYYTLVAEMYPENKNGKYQLEEQEIIYYYQKKNFNMSVDKWIDKVTVNGVEKNGNSKDNSDKLVKVEIGRKEFNATEIKITYKILVTNKGEIEGKIGEVTDYIPDGLEFLIEDNEESWRKEGNKVITESLKDTNLKPGENRELEIILRWKTGEETIGNKQNIAKIDKFVNEPNFEDTVKEDNEAKTSILITIGTGHSIQSSLIILITLSVLMGAGILVISKLEKENK